MQYYEDENVYLWIKKLLIINTLKKQTQQQQQQHKESDIAYNIDKS